MSTTQGDMLPPLRVAFVEERPFIWAENTGSEWVFKGYIPELLDRIKQQIPGGFNATFQAASDNVHGTNEPGGWTGIVGDLVNGDGEDVPYTLNETIESQNWTGIVAELINGKADIGAALTETQARSKVIDFSNEFMSSTVNLLVKKPTFFDLGLGYLVRPLSTDFWIMVLVLILLIGLVFAAIGKFNPYEWGNVAAEKDPRGARNSFTLRNSYLFMFSSLSWQGYLEAPRSYAGRIMAAFWWIFVLFTLIAYTANLTAYMLARPEQMPDLPFRTYDELLSSPDIEIGMLKFGATQDGLRRSHNPTYKELYLKAQKQRTAVTSYVEGVDKVKNSDGNFVMFMDVNGAEYAARQNCELMIYGSNILPNSLAFGFPKGSLWVSKFNRALTVLYGDKTLERLREKYWSYAGQCENVDGRDYVSKGGMLTSTSIYPITLKDMAVAILLLFLGFAVAMVVLIIEIVHYAVTKKGKKIERPAILKNPPKIFRPKGKGAAKPVPTSEEAADEAGPSSDGLESVPLEDTAGASTSEEPAEAKQDV